MSAELWLYEMGADGFQRGKRLDPDQIVVLDAEHDILVWQLIDALTAHGLEDRIPPDPRLPETKDGGDPDRRAGRMR